MAKGFFICNFLFISTIAQAESLFLSCSQETSEYSYEVSVYQTIAWEKVGPGDERSEARIEAVRTDKNGKKSVRNFTGDMHRYPKHKRMWVGLYKGNTDHGKLEVEYSRRHVSKALVRLYGENERELALECSFE